jgi:hypothetical protein
VAMSKKIMNKELENIRQVGTVVCIKHYHKSSWRDRKTKKYSVIVASARFEP